MSRITAKSLTSLLSEAQETTADILRRFEEQLRQFLGRSPGPGDGTRRKRIVLDMAAAHARVELKDMHRRLVHAIGTMQMRNVITHGEAAPLQHALEKLIEEAVQKITQQVEQITSR